VKEKENDDKLIIPGEINVYPMNYDISNFEAFLKEEDIDYENLSNLPEIVFLTTFLGILRTEGVIEVEDTIPQSTSSGHLSVYYVRYTDDEEDSRIVCINKQEKRNRTITYSIKPTETGNLIDRYYKNK